MKPKTVLKLWQPFPLSLLGAGIIGANRELQLAKIQRTTDHWGVKRMKSSTALFMDVGRGSVSSVVPPAETLKTAFPH